MADIKWTPVITGSFHTWNRLRHAPDQLRPVNGHKCPKCWGTEVAEKGEWEGEGGEDETILKFECHTCGCEWVNVYDGEGKWKRFFLRENLLG